MPNRCCVSRCMALSCKTVVVGEEGRTAGAPPPTITRKGGFDVIEAMMGSYQVLLASSALVCPVHGVQGVLYEVAIPKLGMALMSVYVVGERDMYVEEGTLFLVRFEGLRVYKEEDGCYQATADYIECVQAIREGEFTQ